MRADPLERIIAAMHAHGCRPKNVRGGVGIPGQGRAPGIAWQLAERAAARQTSV